jgi:MSHA pilin protein MshC
MKAFTLVELIIVLVVVGILAVSATPLFIGTGGTEARVLREQAKAVLRNIQLQTMQDTDGACRVVLITPQTLGRPRCKDCSDPSCKDCSDPSCEDCPDTSCEANDGSLEPDDYELLVGAPKRNDRLLGFGDNTLRDGEPSSLPQIIQFDGLGRPITPGCQTNCKLTFSEPAGATASLCINKEGYIYDC